MTTSGGAAAGSARTRARVYDALARGFQEPTPALVTWLVQLRVEQILGRLSRRTGLSSLAAAGRALSGAAAAVLGSMPDSAANLEAVYHRLFSGAGPRPVSPYASVHTSATGLVMGEAALRAEAAYRAAGLALDAGSGELPDHIGVEMEFLAYLCRREARAWRDGQHRDAATWLRMQRGFLQQDLLPWLPRFADRLHEAVYADLRPEAGWQGADLYAALGRLAAEFVALDAAWVSSLLAALGSQPPAGIPAE